MHFSKTPKNRLEWEVGAAEKLVSFRRSELQALERAPDVPSRDDAMTR